MKKILIVWNYALDPKHGGIERVSSSIIKGLINRGYIADNLISKINSKDFYINNVISDNTHLSLNQLRSYLTQTAYNVIVCQDGFNSEITNVIKDAAPSSTKVLSCLHFPPTMWENMFSLETIFYKIKYSKNISDILFWLKRLSVYPFWRRRALKQIIVDLQDNYNVSDGLVLLSPQFFPDIQRYLRLSTTDKLFAIPNPLSFESSLTPELLQDKKKEVLIVSRMDESQKRISYALKVWKRVQRMGYVDWKLIIVGYGPDDEYYRKMVDKGKIGNVFFEGWKDSFQYYKTASIFLMTSDFEGWGMTLTESLQMGVVPIVRDTYLSLHDILTDGYNGYIVKKNDMQAYVERVVFLMKNPEERISMAQNGLLSSKNFSIENVARKWDELIKSI